MKTFPFVISRESGLSSEQAAVICSEAERYESHISIARGEVELSAQSIIGLIALQAACGDEIVVIISGKDEQAAEAGMREILERELA